MQTVIHTSNFNIVKKEIFVYQNLKNTLHVRYLLGFIISEKNNSKIPSIPNKTRQAFNQLEM